MEINCKNNIFSPSIYLNFKSGKSDSKISPSLSKDVFVRNKSHSVPSREDFLIKYKKDSKSLNRFLAEHILPENLIGSGMHSDVYKFSTEEFKDYVIKVCKSEKNMNIPVNMFVKTNLGQPIAKLSDSVYILKKQEGSEHSIHNWTAVVRGREELTRNQAVKFYNDVRKISKFPQESYNDYAHKLKILYDNKYKSDSLNPNNMLIDFENKKINFVDFYPAKRDVKKDCYIDMVASLLDYRLYPKFMSLLTSDEQKNMISFSNKIVEKSYNAAKVIGLSLDENVFLRFIADLDSRWENAAFVKEYDCFKTYVNII